MSEIKRNWYLLMAHPRQDAVAHAHLERQNFEVYRPVAWHMHKHRQKMIPRIESLFSRYIFVHVDMDNERWQPIQYTTGVSKFIRFGKDNYPTKIPDKFIAQVRDLEKALSDRLVNVPALQQGEEVVILEEGLFYGKTSIFQNYDGNNRALVMLEILKQEVMLNVSADYLEKKAA